MNRAPAEWSAFRVEFGTIVETETHATRDVVAFFFNDDREPSFTIPLQGAMDQPRADEISNKFVALVAACLGLERSEVLVKSNAPRGKAS
jgi:hypothetical protein